MAQGGQPDTPVIPVPQHPLGPSWWPDVPLLKPWPRFPVPVHPKPMLPDFPGDARWDDPFWYA